MGVDTSTFECLGVDGPLEAGSYALLNVFLIVGDTAERVSNLRLDPEPFPKVNDCGGASEVFNESFGRADERGICGCNRDEEEIVSVAVMVDRGCS